jgi:hypothetical protein
MCQDEYEAAVAAFIHTKGVTRCPTACALRTQGAVAAADRATLAEYAATRERLREQRIAARTLWFRALEARHRRPSGDLHQRRFECRP